MASFSGGGSISTLGRGPPINPPAAASKACDSQATKSKGLTGKKKPAKVQDTANSPSSSQPGTFQIHWDVTHTNTLVEYLLIHPADCHILFSDKNTGNLTPQPQTTTTKPSGHTKKDIQAVVAKVIFEGDMSYGEGYHKIPDKFQVRELSPAIHNIQIFLGNPSYDPDHISSELKKNHAEGFLSLVISV
ncbi:hypothetical protein BDN67DRAFT_986288 [Paxillus ammoniavirescens]|nr:hypothetical protein BDN67DRAFT_986288 [Paxillus ammoniavirescens]